MKTLILLFSFSTLSHAQSTAPTWCQDLGIARCEIDRHARPQDGVALSPSVTQTQHFLATLNQYADPGAFLPEELAEHVRQCRRERASGRVTRPCSAGGPLAGRLAAITFIPADTVDAARLPSSGVRIVVGCGHRHLQIRSDIPRDQLRALLRRALSEYFQVISSGFLMPVALSTGSLVQVRACELASGRESVSRAALERRIRRSAVDSVWTFNQTSSGWVRTGSGSRIPDAYAADCLYGTESTVRRAPHPRALSARFSTR